MACVTGAIAFVLALIGVLLTAPSGYSVEDFLGWGRTGADSPAVALTTVWQGAGMQGLAQLYLALDMMAFVPCYAAAFAMLAHALSEALARDRQVNGQASGQTSGHVQLLALPLVALVLIDQLENTLGGVRLLQAPDAWLWSGVWVAAALIGRTLWLRTGSLALIGRHWRGRAWLGGAALALVIIYAAGVRQVAFCAPAGTSGWAWPMQWQPDTYGCAAHHAKQAVVGLVTLMFVVMGLLWLFGALIKPDADGRDGKRGGDGDGDGDGGGQPPSPRDLRDALRSAIGDMLLRSRYVLIALVLLIVFYLVMDQARDVVYAALAVDSGAWLSIVSHGAVVAAGIAAVWCLAFSAWLWTRSVCEILPPLPRDRASPNLPDAADSFARGWARLLGMAPLLIAAALALLVCKDAVAGFYVLPSLKAGLITASAALLSLVYGGLVLLFIWNRNRQAPPSGGHYYNSQPRPSWLPPTGAIAPAPKAKYTLLGLVTPRWLFALSLWGFFAARALQLGEGVPSLAQAGIALMLAFWLCVFGWFSLLEVRRAVPWVLMLALGAGALGLVNANGHHGLWSPLADPAAPVGSGLDMLVAAAVLALLLQGLYELAMWLVSRPDPVRWPLWAWPLVVALALGLAVGAMSVADHQLSARAVRQLPDTTPPDPRPTLDDAMAQWLKQLCEGEKKAAAGGCAAGAGAARIPVYFIATAGGGVRAAAWTASVLQQWQHEDPRFAARTFVISGVSGGSVGAAVFKACLGPDDAMGACVDRYLRADLLSPLLSAWMFEDVLGSLLPSRPCAQQPGCGFLSRAAWFEAGLERAVPALRANLGTPAGTPHLLLNATWVESGERAIASDIRLGQDFPGARDQLDLLPQRDLPLSTAAHNSARFPYTNAIGELNGTVADCVKRAEPAPSAARIDPPLKPCGHLADGGYYDNSGMASLVDALQGLKRYLMKEPSATPGLRERLQVHVIMLRNSPRLSDLPLKHCPGSTGLPSAAEVAPSAPSACRAPFYEPGLPACIRSQHFFIDEIGPPLAVVMTSGIGAHGRRDEALMHRAATEMPVPTQVHAIDLLQKAVHYPLGWHLSEAAVSDVRQQARACRLPQLESTP